MPCVSQPKPSVTAEVSACGWPHRRLAYPLLGYYVARLHIDSYTTRTQTIPHVYLSQAKRCREHELHH